MDAVVVDSFDVKGWNSVSGYVFINVCSYLCLKLKSMICEKIIAPKNVCSPNGNQMLKPKCLDRT